MGYSLFGMTDILPMPNNYLIDCQAVELVKQAGRQAGILSSELKGG
jgi:hypothetical protein